MLEFERTEQPHTAYSTSAMAIEHSRNMVIEHSRNMETRDHSNGVSPKNHRSRENGSIMNEELRIMRKFALFLVVAMLLNVASALAQSGSDILWKKNFGGSGANSYKSVTAVSDGVIAVGSSQYFGNGDWSGVTGKGSYDAIIVKYDNSGNVVWKKNFGGSDEDHFSSVTTVVDGIVAVGRSNPDSFGNGDWAGVTGKGGGDAIIVKYDNVGNVVWKKNFGGSFNDSYYSVTTVSDGVVAVGFSHAGSFGNGDWADVTEKGGFDAIIVKYDNSGNVVWKKNFGGSDWDQFTSVTAVSDGIVAVGYSNAGSFGNGDWAGITGKGGTDAIMVKYDNSGNVVWKKNFGGSDSDSYESVTTVSDGVIAVGYSNAGSFGNGDWASVTGKGGYDAIVVKYDNSGNVVWRKNFGGSGSDFYYSVTTVSDGIVAVGLSHAGSFGNGDWASVTGKGGYDAIIVKYDNSGNVVWKKNFGGSDWDQYDSVTAISDGVIAVGYSGVGSFGNGDWAGVTGKGSVDAIIVKYGTFIPVTNITDVPTTTTVGTPLTLTGTVVPSNAIYQTIVWSVINAGTTGATINGNTFNAMGGGTATIKATITNGLAIGTDYTQDFNITVNIIPVTNITDVPTVATVNIPLTLTGTVEPSNATNQTIVWSVKDAGTTGAVIGGNILFVAATGTATITATITNGLAAGTDYTQDFDIIVNGTFVPVTNITGVPTAATVNIPLTLTGTVEPSNATNQTIAWSVKDAGTTGAVIGGNILFVTATGTATITATITNGLAAGTDYTQDFDIEIKALSIDEGAELYRIKVFPNPTTGQLRVTSDELQVAGIEIFDIYGKMLLTRTSHITSEITVDISEFSSGVYFVKIRTEAGEVVRKVLKE